VKDGVDAGDRTPCHADAGRIVGVLGRGTETQVEKLFLQVAQVVAELAVGLGLPQLVGIRRTMRTLTGIL
jgi:hypothetical protein